MESKIKGNQGLKEGRIHGLSIVSINVNGLNAQNKQGRIFKQLRKLKADICYKKGDTSKGK